MSLKNILLGVGRRVFGKKPDPSPATGKSQKLLTYEGQAAQDTGKNLAKQELKNPPVVLKKTNPLHMGDKTAPAFGSSTYDWIMRKGRGEFSADEWLNHLTSTRKMNFKIFNRSASKTVREPKRFKYDSGPFQGKEVLINKEELFDSNLAIFNEAGDLTGGLLYAAKKFGLNLDANQLGAMIKLNPVNRLRPVELGMPKGAQETFDRVSQTAADQLKTIKKNYSSSVIRGSDEITEGIDEVIYKLGGLKNSVGRKELAAFGDELKMVRNNARMRPEDRKVINKVLGEVNEAAAPMQNSKTFYKGESSYTLQGGKDYRETIFILDDPIKSNRNPFNRGGHFNEVLPAEANNLYHIRFDTRFTPEGKKVFMINEIQSDVNQSVAKGLSKAKQLSGESRTNPFQADIEMNLLSQNRSKLMDEISEATLKRQPIKVNALTKEMRDIQTKMDNVFRSSGRKDFDYFPLVEADAYGDHALKYLVQKAAREGVDYVAVAPFNKLSFRQGYKAGNERFYGYATGKGIDKKGKAVMPDLMKRLATFYNSKAGPTKLTLSDPKLTYKSVSTETFKYPDKHSLSGKSIKNTFHEDAVANPKKGYKLIQDGDPRLYFDAFAIKVNPLMRNTQKTYKSQGGLVVDIFKPIRYN